MSRFRRFTNRFIEFLLIPLSKSIVLAVSSYTLLWGLWVVNPFWDVFTTAQLYSALLSFAPEWFWGGFALVCGGVAMVSAFYNHVKGVSLSSLASGWHWLIVGILYFMGDWHNTGGITAMFLVLFCLYIYLNCKLTEQAKKEKEQKGS